MTKQRTALIFFAKIKACLTCNFLGIILDSVFIGRANVLSIIPISVCQKTIPEHELLLKQAYFYLILKTVQNNPLLNIL